VISAIMFRAYLLTATNLKLSRNSHSLLPVNASPCVIHILWDIIFLRLLLFPGPGLQLKYEALEITRLLFPRLDPRHFSKKIKRCKRFLRLSRSGGAIFLMFVLSHRARQYFVKDRRQYLFAILEITLRSFDNNPLLNTLLGQTEHIPR
jgi:hypothetical protein